ncbi:MAG: tetratricopeptide repeat protein, partial [Bacteroidia bacterium]|nr:tetratricopeptide repeat protein [Bacteroidia bacterium]
MKKPFNIILFIILNLFQQFSFSKKNDIDSLKLALKNATHDTTRCNILNLLTELGDDTEWPVYNNQLKSIAENASINTKPPLKYFYLKHLASSITNIGFLANEQGEISKAVVSYGKAQLIFDELCKIYPRNFEIKKGTAACLLNRGNIFEKKGEIKTALEFYHKALKIFQEIKSKGESAIALNSIALIHLDQGNSVLALHYLQTSLKIREEIKDKHGEAVTLTNIANFYNSQDDFTKALDYFERSLKIQEEIKDRQGIAISLNNIGSFHQKQKQFLLALDYYKKSLKIREEIKDKQGIAYSLNNIGVAYQDLGKLDTALKYYFSSLKIRKETTDKKGITSTLINIADLLVRQGKIDNACKFAEEGMQNAKELGYPEYIKRAANILKRIYKKQNKSKQAFEMFELFIQMRDSLSNQETKKASIKTQLKYEYEKKSAADSVKNAEQQKVKDAQLAAQTASLKQEKFQRYSLVAGLLIVLGGLGFVINRFRITSKQKKIIEEQKIKVDEAFEKLHEKNKEVMDSIYYARRIQRA